MSEPDRAIKHFILIPAAPKEVPELLRKLAPLDSVRYRWECDGTLGEGATYAKNLILQIEAIIARQRIDRYSADEAAHFLSLNTGDTQANWLHRIVTAIQHKQLASYGPESVAPRLEPMQLSESSVVEVYGDDLNQWVPTVAKRATYRFPPASQAASTGMGVAAPETQDHAQRWIDGRRLWRLSEAVVYVTSMPGLGVSAHDLEARLSSHDESALLTVRDVANGKPRRASNLCVFLNEWLYAEDFNSWMEVAGFHKPYRLPLEALGIPEPGPQFQPAPLPPMATLSEAADWLRFTTGITWTARALVGCAARGEVTLWGPLQTEAKLVSIQPRADGQNEATLVAGIIAPIDTDSAAKLLHGPATTFTGLDHWCKLPGLPPIESSYVIERVWAIAEGTEAPKVFLQDCSILAKHVERLAQQHTKPSEQVRDATDQIQQGTINEALDTKAQSAPTTWWAVASRYMVEKLRAGQYKTAKSLYHALEAEAGGETSPFAKGVGTNRGSLFVKEISQTLSLKTVQNNWAQLKNAARSVD